MIEEAAYSKQVKPSIKLLKKHGYKMDGNLILLHNKMKMEA